MHLTKAHLGQGNGLWPRLTIMGTFAFALMQWAGDGAGSLSSEVDWSQTTRIVYLYGDSSVPPQYHRSYKIDVRREDARVTIDSYGTVLADKSYSIMRADFDGLLKSLSQNSIRNVPPRDDDSCTGGASETISTFNQQKLTFSGRVYHCGGEDFGDLGGNVRGFADDLRALFPDLPVLLH